MAAAAMTAATAAVKCGVRGQYMSNHLGDKPRYPVRYSPACLHCILNTKVCIVRGVTVRTHFKHTHFYFQLPRLFWPIFPCTRNIMVLLLRRT